MSLRDLRTVSQQPIPVVIVEIKSVELLAPAYRTQLLTCLRLGDKRLGLPISLAMAMSVMAALYRFSPRREDAKTATTASGLVGFSQPG